MTNKINLILWFDFTQSRYFLIPKNQKITPGNLLLFNLTGKRKKVALTAIADFEITESEANTYLEKELNKLFEQIEIGEDIQQEIPKMLEEIFSESNIKKYLPDFAKKLAQIEDNPELLQQLVYEFYTSLSQDFFKEREKQLEEKRQQEYKKSAKEAVEKALSSFNVPTFTDTDWMPEIDLLINEDE